jgi:hypothetical protein
MLVKLETRELKQKELIASLEKNNKALEIATWKLGEQNKSLLVSLRENTALRNLWASAVRCKRSHRRH